MTKLEARIEQLKKFKQYFYTTDKPADLKSYFQLLDYHIELLEEVRALVVAFERDDVEFITKWFERRSK